MNETYSKGCYTLTTSPTQEPLTSHHPTSVGFKSKRLGPLYVLDSDYMDFYLRPVKRFNSQVSIDNLWVLVIGHFPHLLSHTMTF